MKYQVQLLLCENRDDMTTRKEYETERDVIQYISEKKGRKCLRRVDYIFTIQLQFFFSFLFFFRLRSGVN